MTSCAFQLQGKHCMSPHIFNNSTIILVEGFNMVDYTSWTMPTYVWVTSLLDKTFSIMPQSRLLAMLSDAPWCSVMLHDALWLCYYSDALWCNMTSCKSVHHKVWCAQIEKFMPKNVSRTTTKCDVLVTSSPSVPILENAQSLYCYVILYLHLHIFIYTTTEGNMCKFLYAKINCGYNYALRLCVGKWLLCACWQHSHTYRQH